MPMEFCNSADRITVLVAIPNMGWVRKELLAACLRLQDQNKYGIAWDLTTGMPIDSSRNRIIKRFLKYPDQQWLLFIDSDNPPMQHVNPLDLIDAEKEADMWILPTPMWKGSLGKMRMGKYPIMWNAVIEVKDPHGDWGWASDPRPRGRKEVDGGGAGCMLISRRVLEHPEMKPWFAREWDEYGIQRRGSDFLFCKRVKQLGFKIWTDYDYLCSHWKERDLAELHQFMRVRDLSQIFEMADRNPNSPGDWDERWKKRGERILPMYERIVDLCREKTVVDFGCGRGDLLQMFKDAGITACGVDHSSVGIEKCTERGLNATIGNAPVNGHDVIVATEVLEHLDDDRGMLKEMCQKAVERVIYTVPFNCLPPAVEPEHRRVYTLPYIKKITPGIEYVEDFGDYIMVVVDAGKAREEIDAGSSA